MAKLKFRQENDQDTKIALCMSSKDGEEVKLSSPCDCEGQVSLPFMLWHFAAVTGQKIMLI